ncbi:MAG: ATP-binding protein, partial [Candidatus Rokuibacteriota bacterium]
TINQFLGDGFMALFGAPLAHEDHARRAVLAALGLQRALAERPLQTQPGRPVPVRLRMGLHTGFVVVGAIGDNLRMDYTAVGDTTHLAARLQQLAEPGTIVVSDATARLVRGYARLEPLGPVEVRGRSAPVEVHRVTGVGARRSPLEGLDARRLSLFSGRDRELRALCDLFAEVDAGRGQAVGIVGEPGVGKSRLLLEFRRALADRRVTYLEGRCVSFGSAIPYMPVLDIVRSNCGINEGDPPETVVEKVRVALEELGINADTAAPLLLQLLGQKDAASERLAGLGPEAVKTRTFDVLRQMSLRGSRRWPLVFALEDLHWIDRTSEEYLTSLTESLAGVPIMLLATYRPGYRPGWMEKSFATQLSLARLTPADSLSIVRSVLPEVGLADPLARLILEKAEGNPFFLEELAHAVGEGAPSPDLRIPDTVHGVLTARIDRLAEQPKRLLQTASILGREFSVRLLEALWDGGPFDAHLHELTRQEFIHERSGTDEPTYAFKHALTQDVAESTLLAGRRRELHLRAAEALAGLDPDRLGELAPVLAHHYYAAEAWPLACEHAARAAEAASAAYANREALARYDQALGAAERAALSPAERMRLLAARAGVHGVLGSFEPARLDLEGALALAEAAGDVGARATYLGELATLWGGHKDYRRGLELTEEAVRTAERAGDRRALAVALLQTGLMHANLGRISESRRGVERALEIFGELGDERGYAQTLDVLAMVNGINGRLRVAVEQSEEALRRFRALGDRAAEPLITNIGFFLAWAGDGARCEALIREGLEAALAIGSRSGEAYAHHALAVTFEAYGNWGRAFDEAQAGLSIAREIGHLEWTTANLSVLGRLRRHCGDAGGARALHEEMVRVARELGSVIWVAEALGELGEDLAALGDAAAAAAALDESVATADELVKFAAHALIGLAELRLAQGTLEAALEAARRAQTIAAEYRVATVDARRVEGEALLGLGDLDGAEAALRQAKADAAAMEAEPARWRACLGLADLLAVRGRYDDAARERAEALTALERVAADLPDDLRASFAETTAMQRARA